MSNLLYRVSERFFEHFGSEPTILAMAPGRVNLIGEHTDYHEGFVFPAAIDRHVVVAAKVVEAASTFVSEIEGESAPFDTSCLSPAALTKWTRYGAGMAWVFEKQGHVCPNLQAYVVSDLPYGAGLSSSAAMEMAFGWLFRHLTAAVFDDVTLARLGQQCENQFVGAPCGLMDQLASAMGKAGHALFIDCRSPEGLAPIPIPEGLSIVVCDTGAKHDIGDSGYPLRRRQSEQAAQILGVRFLRDATEAQLIAQESRMPDVLYRRARHVITECARVESFKNAFEKLNYSEIGKLMRASHDSMRFDYEASCEELNAMVEACEPVEGCVGVRMTGGGFGGACVALVEDERCEDFAHLAGERYLRATGLEGKFYTCRAANGAQIVLDSH